MLSGRTWERGMCNYRVDLGTTDSSAVLDSLCWYYRVDCGSGESTLVLQNGFCSCSVHSFYSKIDCGIVQRFFSGHAHITDSWSLPGAGQCGSTAFSGLSRAGDGQQLSLASMSRFSGRARDHEIQKQRASAGLARRRSSIVVLQSRWPNDFKG